LQDGAAEVYGGADYGEGLKRRRC
jgi:hypothetical protein